MAETEKGLLDLLKDYAPLVAYAALAQPWLVWVWKQYVRRGKVDIYETGTVSVGFTQWGATIGLNGTLRATERDLFIRTIKVEVIKERDRSHHSFEWGLFRDPTMSSDAVLELPAGFMLSTANPYRYNIMFYEPQLKEEITPYINSVRDSWTQTVLDSGARELLQQGSNVQQQDVSELQNRLNQQYTNFKSQALYLTPFREMERKCYWEPGRYLLKMSVYTEKPDRVHNSEWHFSISEQDARRLRNNTSMILDNACSRGNFQYNFSESQYET